MTAASALALGLVLAGLCQLAAGLHYVRRIIRELPEDAANWKILLVLVICFMVGYAYYAVLVWEQPATMLALLVAFVFGSGGTFVLMVTRLSAVAIREVRRATLLRQENQIVSAMKVRLQRVLDNIAEGIVVFDREGRLETMNARANQVFGYDDSSLPPGEISQLIPGFKPWDLACSADGLDGVEPSASEEREAIGRHRDGHLFPIAVKVGAFMVDGERLFTALISDITERKATLERLRAMAEGDELTGLRNRAYFHQMLTRSLEGIRRFGGHHCLLYVDLDRFKHVNDRYGHLAGDRVLVDVASLLRQSVRSSDLLARLGGDEFTVLLFNVAVGEGLKVAQALRDNVAAYQFRHAGAKVEIGCSVGVTAITQNNAREQEILAQADAACHLAKKRGRNRVCLFDGAMLAARNRHDGGWIKRLDEALAENRFVLAFQPIVRTDRSRILGHEVLLRMIDDAGELLLPRVFLEPAKRFDLAPIIDRWVISHLLGLLTRHRQQWRHRRFFVNISGGTLSDPGFYGWLDKEVSAAGVDVQALTFEISVAVALTDMALAEDGIRRLKQAGFFTALDNFDIAASSFSYLTDLPVDYVKIDGIKIDAARLRGTAQGQLHRTMLRAVNDIVHVLGKRSIMQQVEDAEFLRTLQYLGIDHAQGHELGRPILELADDPRLLASPAA